MALANVAAELAQRGRRVLAVDFDLEAPGLDTFDLPKPKGIVPGLVDFVGEYLVTGRTPVIEKFVFESEGVGRDGGGLWIMPSGAHQDTYANTLASINWCELYEQHDGYLMFEDLKEQWRHHVKPDYVLIDSRTGHTDVGGICTRQLPDAVAILFFPNSQNLRGLTKVVRDIRAEARVPGKSEIVLHFIMSNVPDLDDEDEILADTVSSFEQDLEFHEPLTIHRYDSLSLLNQVIFTKDRPRSRLAREYQIIAEEIMNSNLKDSYAALNYLEDIAPPRLLPRSRTASAAVRQRRVSRQAQLRGMAPSRRSRAISQSRLHHPLRWRRRSRETWPGSRQAEIDKNLNTIRRSHGNNGEVLFRLGVCQYLEDDLEGAADLFDRSIKAGYRDPEVYLSRAQLRQQVLEDPESAQADAAIVINSPDAEPGQVLEALGIIGAENLEKTDDLTGLYARSPSDRIIIAEQLNSSRAEARIAMATLLPQLHETGLSREEANATRHLVALSSIAVGNFSAAIDALQGQASESQSEKVVNAFNLAVALWGETGEIVREPFERAVDLDRGEANEHPGANRLQCMALAHWAVGSEHEAQGLAEGAIREIRSQGGHEFSCWQYLRIPTSEFERDVGELQRLISGDPSVQPRFLVPTK